MVHTGDPVQAVSQPTKSQNFVRNFPSKINFSHLPTFMRLECLLKRNIDAPGTESWRVDLRPDFNLGAIPPISQEQLTRLVKCNLSFLVHL
jgi:hypothetical protein